MPDDSRTPPRFRPDSLPSSQTAPCPRSVAEHFGAPRPGANPLILLRFFLHGREAFHVPMPGHRARVGRGGECEIRLPDATSFLSRVHFVLERRGDGLLLLDVSSNGTALDGSPAPRAPAAIPYGATVRAGAWELRAERQSADSHGDASDESTVGAPASASARPAGASGSAPVPGPDSFCGIVGRSPQMRALYQQIARLARHEVPILVLGETGSGKERVADALHQCSPRSRGPLVVVNCGAIHVGTAASALFGHEKGAFTGAAERHLGALRQAHGGTLFLDELGELALETQAALLRALETRQVQPLGGRRTERVDFRLLAATHRELRSAVAAGRFREDLYFRVAVATLRVPPLRERRSDIPLLAAHFVAELAAGGPPELAPDAVDALQRAPWPGNVRELRNAVLRALVACGDGPIRAAHLELDGRLGLFAGLPAESAEAPRPGQVSPAPNLLASSGRLDMQRRDLVAALEKHRGNRAVAARDLGISRSTIYEWIKRFGVEADES
jgi:DNA-binding NtrC family response regulator